MRVAAYATIFLSALLPFPSHANAQASRTYSSELGFQLSYSADWAGNSLGPMLSADKISLDPQARTDPYRRSIECAQNLFSARTGEPRSTFLIGVIGSDCMGESPDLDTFGRRTLNTLSRRYQLSGVQFGAFLVQGQKFWILHATGVENSHPGQSETIEYLATILPRGLVYLAAHALTPQAQSSFDHARLHLSSGVDTELIPSGALNSKQPAAEDMARLGSASTSGGLIPYDAHASHHFDIGAGFTWEVPAEFNIYNTEKWLEAQQKEDPAVKPHQPGCHVERIIAGPEDGARLVIVTTFEQKCLSLKAVSEDLTLLLANDTINLQKKYVLHNPVYAEYTAGAHSFAVMRCTATNKQRSFEADRSLALVLTPIPDGIAEFFLVGRSPAALDAIMATALKLDDGTQTTLVPASAMAKAQPVPAAQVNASGAHTFDSGLGFSLVLPADLLIVNAQEAVAEAKSMAAQESRTRGEKVSIQCAQPVLMAGHNDLSRMVSIVTFAQDCIGYPLNAQTLPTLGQSGNAELAKRYELSSTQTARITTSSHSLWAMRTGILPHDPTDNHRFMAALLVPFEGGVAEFLMGANTQADLDALMAIPLRFSDGSETTVIPAEAFSK